MARTDENRGAIENNDPHLVDDPFELLTRIYRGEFTMDEISQLHKENELLAEISNFASARVEQLLDIQDAKLKETKNEEF